MTFQKTVTLCFALLVLFSAGSLQAQKVDADTILPVSKLSVAPLIDGEMDTLWTWVPQQLMLHIVQSPENVDDWYDWAYAFRCAYDDENFYFYVNAIDDDLWMDETQNHEDDSWECYFDADLSQGPSYDGQDDIQLRFGWTLSNEDITGSALVTDGVFDKSAVEFYQVDTDLGWDSEVAIPLSEIQLYPDPDYQFGFEFDGNEDDEGEGRDAKFKWWGYDDQAWTDPSVFGVAQLTDREVSNVLDVHYTSVAPQIDAVKDDIWSEAANLASTSILSYDNILDWRDCRLQYRTMWDDANLYFWIEVYDDMLIRDGTGNHEDDGVELYIDGDNSKGTTYDGANDFQFALRYSGDDAIVSPVHLTGSSESNPADLSGIQQAAALHDSAHGGMIIELAIPHSVTQIPPADGSLFGFELDYNDDDGDTGSRDTKLKTVSKGDDTWQNPSMMGTAMLTKAAPLSVKSFDAAVATDYQLSQNYPNPFNPSTTIAYTIPASSNVRITVFDMLGKEIATLVDEIRPAGSHAVQFDGSDLASGVYFYRMTAGTQTQTAKMLLIK